MMHATDTQAHRLASSRALEVRPLELTIADDTPQNWMGGEAWETQLLNGLSLIFPPGERFFMRSVRKLKQHAVGAVIQEQVRAFLAQEGFHSREHSVFNSWLAARGLPVARIEKGIEAGIIGRSKWRSDIGNLAMTAALEHFTAMLAKVLLTDPSLRARFHPNVLPLWYWHAIEELDHKAVAFDVYQAAGGSYPRRAAAMIAASVGLPVFALIIQWHLLGSIKQRGDVGAYVRGLRRYIGADGILTKALPDYLRYFHPKFHPWQEDDRALIAHAERELAAMLATLAASTVALNRNIARA